MLSAVASGFLNAVEQRSKMVGMFGTPESGQPEESKVLDVEQMGQNQLL